jgi:predicted RNase H-like nuclease
MTWIAGIDACKGGWCVVLCNVSTEDWTVDFVSNFAEALALPQAPEVICVDMPIGLPEHTPPGGRDCEKLARQALKARRSSVFSPVGRQSLTCSCRQQADALSRASGGIGISAQAWGLREKLLQVDREMTVDRQELVFEVHPEVSFWAMNNRTSMQYAKKKREGKADRKATLKRNGVPAVFIDRELIGRFRSRRDDFLDACAAAWTARRICSGVAERLPQEPMRDAKGLDMAIWF